MPVLALALTAARALAEMVLALRGFSAGGTLPAAQVLNGFGCPVPTLSPALQCGWRRTVAKIPAAMTGFHANARAERRR